MIRPWRHLGVAFAAGLPLVVALTPPQPIQAQPSGLGEDFGRWETRLRRCRMVALVEGAPPVVPKPCQVLRLDQQLPGLLSVRFLPAGSEARLTKADLVFAGVLEQGGTPMRCRQGRCEPRWPIRLLVSAVAPGAIEPGSSPHGIPLARIARGQCLLVRRSVVCQAGEPGGHRWEASGRW